MRRYVLTLAALALSIATGCGTATRTVTTTVVTPAPPTPATQTAPRVIVHTHTVRETPKACIEAIHVAARVFGIAGKAIKELGELAPLVKEAAAAGLEHNEGKILSIGAKTQRVEGSIEREANAMTVVRASLKAAPGSC